MTRYRRVRERSSIDCGEPHDQVWGAELHRQKRHRDRGEIRHLPTTRDHRIGQELLEQRCCAAVDCAAHGFTMHALDQHFGHLSFAKKRGRLPMREIRPGLSYGGCPQSDDGAIDVSSGRSNYLLSEMDGVGCVQMH